MNLLGGADGDRMSCSLMKPPAHLTPSPVSPPAWAQTRPCHTPVVAASGCKGEAPSEARPKSRRLLMALIYGAPGEVGMGRPLGHMFLLPITLLTVTWTVGWDAINLKPPVAGRGTSRAIQTTSKHRTPAPSAKGDTGISGHASGAWATRAKSEYLLLKVEDVHIDNIKSDNLGASRGEPAAGGGMRNTSPTCVSDVTGRSDKIVKAMIIAAQDSSRGSLDSIMTAVDPTATSERADTT